MRKKLLISVLVFLSIYKNIECSQDPVNHAICGVVWTMSMISLADIIPKFNKHSISTDIICAAVPVFLLGCLQVCDDTSIKNGVYILSGMCAFFNLMRIGCYNIARYHENNNKDEVITELLSTLDHAVGTINFVQQRMTQNRATIRTLREQVDLLQSRQELMRVLQNPVVATEITIPVGYIDAQTRQAIE
ncbi:MAG TPA: hypothetical protein VLG50_04540 [Candidatus Saccharimonadales bacterium]|nr:hypothetical protein [Candidatus Saccharimonadales bacterium]